MPTFEIMLQKFRALSSREVKELMLRALDDHLESASDFPPADILTDEETTLLSHTLKIDHKKTSEEVSSEG